MGDWATQRAHGIRSGRANRVVIEAAKALVREWEECDGYPFEVSLSLREKLDEMKAALEDFDRIGPVGR